MPEPEAKEGRIFVFGSNTAGRHGKGAAKVALEQYGAVLGVGIGLRGRSYALPTKYEEYKTKKLLRLSLVQIKHYVDAFLATAAKREDIEFHVTKIGCGLANYRDEEIAPMFLGATKNCFFHPYWKQFGLKSYDE